MLRKNEELEKIKKWLIAGIALGGCLFILTAVCLVRMILLSNQVRDMAVYMDDLSYKLDDLSGDTDLIATDVQQILHEATSLLAKTEYTIVGAGAKPETAACRFTLTPKQLAEDTAMELSFGNTKVTLERENNAFTGTLDLPLFEDAPEALLLTVTAAGVTQSELLEGVALADMYCDWLPELFVHSSGSADHGDGKQEMDVAYGFVTKDSNTEAPVTFTKVLLTKAVNGQEEPAQDVTDRLTENVDQGFLELHTAFSMDKTQIVTLTVQAWDSQGYLHELHTTCSYSEDSKSVEVLSGGEGICGPDGTVLIIAPLAETDP